MNVQFNFQDRHVVVFGGTTGINLGIAQAYAAAGAKVSVASRKQANVDAAVPTLGAHGFGVVADVRDDDSVTAALAACVARHGPIDVLVSGAAGNFLADVNSMSSNAFKVVVDIDLVGSFHVARRAFEHLRKPGASLIFITAPQSEVPMPYQAHVCAAKAGVDQFARVLAIEWGAAGVRVNAISPGPMKTLAGAAIGGARATYRHTEQNAPLRSNATLESVGGTAVWLCSDYGAFTTGEVVRVDGGFHVLGMPQAENL